LSAARRAGRADVQQSANGNSIELVEMMGKELKMAIPPSSDLVHELPFHPPTGQLTANAPYHVTPVRRCSSSM
jgi:hypothetical protein